MKNSKLVKIVIGAIVSLIVVVMANQVFAANDFTDLTNTLNSNTSSNNTTAEKNTTSNNTTKNNTTTNNTAKNNTTVLTTNNTTNSTSSYNNSSLPKTGVEDALPATMLVVVFGISAVYAYKKIQDYKQR